MMARGKFGPVGGAGPASMTARQIEQVPNTVTGNIEPEISSAVFVPKGLQDALATNPILAASFPKVVATVVRMSFIHKDTKLRGMVTAKEIEYRTHMTLMALETMYCEQEMSLHQCYDLLLDVVINALRSSRQPVDLAAAQQPGRWARMTESNEPQVPERAIIPTESTDPALLEQQATLDTGDLNKGG